MVLGISHKGSSHSQGCTARFGSLPCTSYVSYTEMSWHIVEAVHQATGKNGKDSYEIISKTTTKGTHDNGTMILKYSTADIACMCFLQCNSISSSVLVTGVSCRVFVI